MKPEPKPEEGTWRAVAVWLTPPFLARLEAIAQEIGTHPGALLREAAVAGLRERIKSWRGSEAYLSRQREKYRAARLQRARAIVETVEGRKRK